MLQLGVFANAENNVLAGGMLDGGGPTGGPQIIRGDEISTKQKIDMLRRQRDEGIISRDEYKRAKQQQQLNQLRKQKKSGILTKADYKLRKAELLDKSHKEKPAQNPEEPVDYNIALAFGELNFSASARLRCLFHHIAAAQRLPLSYLLHLYTDLNARAKVIVVVQSESTRTATAC